MDATWSARERLIGIEQILFRLHGFFFFFYFLSYAFSFKITLEELDAKTSCT